MLVALAALACTRKASQEPEPVLAPAASSPGTDAPITPSAPVPSSPPVAAPAGAPAEPDPDVRTARQTAAFLQELCQRVAAEDLEWLEAHVHFPLRGSTVISEGGGNPLLGGQPHQASLMSELDICKATPASGAQIHSHTVEGDRVTATMTIGQFEQRLTFSTEGNRARLVENTYVPTGSAPGATKKARPHQVSGNVLDATEGFGGLVERVVLRELKERPACVQRYAADDSTSVSLRVHVGKRESETARVLVYAGTVAPASLIGCLQAQLEPELTATFQGSPFEVTYLLQIMIAVSADETDSDIPRLEIRRR